LVIAVWGEMESPCFDLHFLYGKGDWTFPHVLIGSLHFFWGQSDQFVCPFIGLIIFFSLSNLLSHLYILHINPLSYI
jgi:hypothetical protein